MKHDTANFRIRPGTTVDLTQLPTRVEPAYAKGQYKQLLKAHVTRLSALQEMLYASNQHAILIIFQAMDAAGKDGCIKHVMSGVNPQGCDVVSYSHPNPTELKHDFLWRTTRDLPARGKIVIFNRSYYEEVLIVRVHPEILQAQALPRDGALETIWPQRYRSIVDLERHLHANATRIVKIFLHISAQEQRLRLLDRIATQEKNWKLKPSDIEERKYWKQYRRAYEDCLSATSTAEAPWYVVPADDKHSARLFVSHIIVEMLQGLDMSFPKTTPDRQKELGMMRKQLENG